MVALPLSLTGLLGVDPYLTVICPTREGCGPLVDSLRALPASTLAGGKPVRSPSELELVRGGLLYALDALAPAHAIFQENHSAAGSYWHGMLHRREGDFGNACYWFRQAGSFPALDALPDFDPAAFTMECSRARGPVPELVEHQRREWAALMLFCLKRALGTV
jgi:hypothetical protein